jgi:hydrogenase nickel incorporation protein HypA/HybF
MHEESLIRSLLRQVDALAEQHEALNVEQIDVEVGPLSGVESLLLKDAFGRLQGASNYCGRSRLVVADVPLQAICLTCQREFVMRDFQFVCKVCGASSLKILRGDTLLLRDVQMQIVGK